MRFKTHLQVIIDAESSYDLFSTGFMEKPVSILDLIALKKGFVKVKSKVIDLWMTLQVILDIMRKLKVFLGCKGNHMDSALIRSQNSPKERNM